MRRRLNAEQLLRPSGVLYGGDARVLAQLIPLLKHYNPDVVRKTVFNMRKDLHLISEGARSLIAAGEREAAQFLASHLRKW